MTGATIIHEANSRDALRAQLKQMWSSVAGAWQTHAAYVDERAAPITARMLELTAPRRGERVLELACGPGSVGIAASPLVGEDGVVVVSDVAPEMTAIAAARAAALGMRNVVPRDLDLEEIADRDESYDVAVCREGLMLVPDPARAAREIYRVIRRGGRAAISVWGAREHNPWLRIVFETVAAELGVPVPPPNIPHPFSLEDADVLAGVMTGAGFVDVAVEEVAVPYDAASVDEWWQRSCALAGPLARKVAALPAPAAESLRARAADAVRPYVADDGRVHIPGEALVVFGRRR